MILRLLSALAALVLLAAGPAAAQTGASAVPAGSGSPPSGELYFGYQSGVPGSLRGWSAFQMGVGGSASSVGCSGLPALTGDVTTSAGSCATTISPTGVTAGTSSKVTFNAKGQITGSTALGASDITAALGFTPLSTGGGTLSGALYLQSQPISIVSSYLYLTGGYGLYNGSASYLLAPASGANAWTARGDSTSSVQLNLQTSDGATRGAVYADTTPLVGFLTPGGTWRLQAGANGVNWFDAAGASHHVYTDADLSLGAWTTFSPAVQCANGTGSLTLDSSSNAQYSKVGRTVTVSVYVKLSASSGCDYVEVAMPTNPAAGYYILPGREVASTGAAITATPWSANYFLIERYDGTAMVAAGEGFALTGVYQSAS